MKKAKTTTITKQKKHKPHKTRQRGGKTTRRIDGGQSFKKEGRICNVKPHQEDKKVKDPNCPKEWAIFM